MKSRKQEEILKGSPKKQTGFEHGTAVKAENWAVRQGSWVGEKRDDKRVPDHCWHVSVLWDPAYPQYLLLFWKRHQGSL